MISYLIIIFVYQDKSTGVLAGDIDYDEGGSLERGRRLMRRALSYINYFCLILLLIPGFLSTLEPRYFMLRETYKLGFKGGSDSIFLGFPNTIHLQLQCCGIDSVSEWQKTETGIPFSCCNHTLFPPCVLQKSHLEEEHAYKVPCIERFKALRVSNNFFCNSIIGICIILLVLHRSLCKYDPH